MLIQAGGVKPDGAGEEYIEAAGTAEGDYSFAVERKRKKAVSKEEGQCAAGWNLPDPARVFWGFVQVLEDVLDVLGESWLNLARIIIWVLWWFFESLGDSWLGFARTYLLAENAEIVVLFMVALFAATLMIYVMEMEGPEGDKVRKAERFQKRLDKLRERAVK